MTAMRHSKILIATTLLASGMLGLAPAAIAATPTANTVKPAIACETVYWGSTPKIKNVHAANTLHNIRSGRHTCFDRLVIDMNAKNLGYSVKYVDKVYQVGSGQRVHLSGGAILAITVNAPAYDANGNPTYLHGPMVRTLNYSTFKQQAFLGSFEGQTEIAMSTRARLPMRVFTLDGPGQGSRLVIDVAHYWY